MDADYLSQFSCNNPPTKNFQRSPVVIRKYLEDMENGMTEKFIKRIGNRLQEQIPVMTENAYPYDVKEPIKHSCLWYRGAYGPTSVKEYLKNNNIRYITFFENPTHLRSIRMINHYHIFHY